jgi:hypothetical protein
VAGRLEHPTRRHRRPAAELSEPRRRNRLLECENEVLASSRGVPVPGEPAGKRLYPLVSELAASDGRDPSGLWR